VDQEISRETKDRIREAISYTDEEAQNLLEHYLVIKEMVNVLLDILSGIYQDHRRNFENYGQLRDTLANLGGLQRAKSDLEGQLYRTLRRRGRADETRHEDDRRNGEDEGVIKLTSSQKRALAYSKNRQHRNRASERHNDVPGESPNHKG